MIHWRKQFGSKDSSQFPSIFPSHNELGQSIAGGAVIVISSTVSALVALKIKKTLQLFYKNYNTARKKRLQGNVFLIYKCSQLAVFSCCCQYINPIPHFWQIVDISDTSSSIYSPAIATKAIRIFILNLVSVDSLKKLNDSRSGLDVLSIDRLIVCVVFTFFYTQYL